MPMHAADVAVVQLLVAQSASASTAVEVESAGPKFVPVRVKLTEADATLYGDDAVRTGADSQSGWNAMDQFINTALHASETY